MKYRPCPECGGQGHCVSTNIRSNIAWFECDNGHLYLTHTATNGLVLNTRALRAGGPAGNDA